MRLVFALALVLLAGLLAGCNKAHGQCGSNGCGPQASYGGYQSYYSAPQATYSAPAVATQGPSSFRGSDGKSYALHVDGIYREMPAQVAAAVVPVAKVAASGCLCGPDCPCLLSATGFSATANALAKTPAVTVSPEWVTVTINGVETKIREVEIKEGVKPYQDVDGNTYWLRADMVKPGMVLVPAHVWKVQ